MNQEKNKAVESLLMQYSNALNSSNPELLTSLYVSGGVFMPNLGRTISGIEEIRRSASRFFEHKHISIAFELRNIVFEGDFAFVQATSTRTVHKQSTVKVVNETAKDFFILLKEQQQWKIFRYMFNS